MNRTEIFDILTEVLEFNSHETEYDGRMYTYCNFCGTCLSEGKEHGDTCLLTRTRAVLAVDFAPELAAIQAKEDAAKAKQAKREQEARDNYFPPHVNCPDCNMWILKANLKSHRGMTKCKARQALL